MKQIFEAHQLCKLDGPLGPYIDSYERCKPVWSLISAAGWPNVESNRKRLPPSCFRGTFAREHGVDARQETIDPLCSDCWSY